MPNGTIQDSRMPQSPQWGYLEIDENDMEEYKSGKGEYLDRGETGGRPWNKCVIYVANEEIKPPLHRGERVEFEMVQCEIMGAPAWVAAVACRK